MHGQVANVFMCGLLGWMASDQLPQATHNLGLLDRHKLDVLGLSGMNGQAKHEGKK